MDSQLGEILLFGSGIELYVQFLPISLSNELFSVHVQLEYVVILVPIIGHYYQHLS
jgi:hypothetical protein